MQPMHRSGGSDLEQASAAALAHTGGGRVTETEVGDEESLYEVEVTLDDGSQVDVQLNERFDVVGTEQDGGGEDDGPGTTAGHPRPSGPGSILTTPRHRLHSGHG